MEIITIKVSKLKANKENPRSISKKDFEKLVESIKNFPEMLNARPPVIDENFIILGGNQRLKAIKKAGLKEIKQSVVYAFCPHHIQHFQFLHLNK